jgi:hypothetical protein
MCKIRNWAARVGTTFKAAFPLNEQAMAILKRCAARINIKMSAQQKECMQNAFE